MSRGAGHVMRAIEEYLGQLRRDQPVRYSELTRAVYDTDTPSRSQLSAVSRAVRRLEHEGKARRELSGYLTEQPWVRSGIEEEQGRRGGTAGWGVRRETLVFRA